MSRLAPRLFRIAPGYLAASACLLALLVLIALYVRDGFVRPFLGDVLAVIWVHLCIRAVSNTHHFIAASGALAVAFTLEFAQYFRLLEILGLQDVRPARVILGATFDPLDLLAYCIGAALIAAIEHGLARSRAGAGEAFDAEQKEAAER